MEAWPPAMVLAVASVGIESALAGVSSICRMVPSSISASGTKIAPSKYCYHCSTRGEVMTRSYHRPLWWYFRTLSEAGFVVLGLEEPAPTEEFAQGEAGDSWPDTPFLEQITLHCICEACK